MPTQEYPDYSPAGEGQRLPRGVPLPGGCCGRGCAGGGDGSAVPERPAGFPGGPGCHRAVGRRDQGGAAGLPQPSASPCWTSAPAGLIRRRYRKVVRRAKKEAPKPWQTPGEIEADRNLQVPGLHRLYEKARYSTQPCTREDVRALKQGERSPRAGLLIQKCPDAAASGHFGSVAGTGQKIRDRIGQENPSAEGALRDFKGWIGG